MLALKNPDGSPLALDDSCPSMVGEYNTSPGKAAQVPSSLLMDDKVHESLPCLIAISNSDSDGAGESLAEKDVWPS